jgi:site-specific DNA-cytosine methylase
MALGALAAGVVDPRQHHLIEVDPQAANTLRTKCNWRFEGLGLQQQEHLPNVIEGDANVLVYAMAVKAGREQEVVASEEVKRLAQQLPDDIIERLPPLSALQLFMGPPCCGFSQLNSNKACQKSDGDRSLLLTGLTLLTLLKPKFFFLENVAGFKMYDCSSFFLLTLRFLMGMGYTVSFAFVDAPAYGLGETRLRFALWAVLAGSPMPEHPLMTHYHLRDGRQVAPTALMLERPGSKLGGVHCTPPSAQQLQEMRVATDVLAGIPLGISSKKYNISDIQKGSFAEMLHKGAGSKITHHVCHKLSQQLVKRVRAQDKPGWVPKEIVLSGGVRKKEGKFRVSWNAPIPCVKTHPALGGRGGGIMHPDKKQMRTLSVREFMRAQSFPDTFHLCGCIACQHTQMGNAFPPVLAYHVFKMLKVATTT